jgi:hypothetical protein
MTTNFDRAVWAESALSVFADEVMNENIDEETVQDLITDIGHFARQQLGMGRKEVQKLFEVAIGAWSAEDRDPSNEPRENDIAKVEIELVAV